MRRTLWTAVLLLVLSVTASCGSQGTDQPGDSGATGQPAGDDDATQETAEKDAPRQPGETDSAKRDSKVAEAVGRALLRGLGGSQEGEPIDEAPRFDP